MVVSIVSACQYLCIPCLLKQLGEAETRLTPLNMVSLADGREMMRCLAWKDILDMSQGRGLAVAGFAASLSSPSSAAPTTSSSFN